MFNPSADAAMAEQQFRQAQMAFYRAQQNAMANAGNTAVPKDKPGHVSAADADTARKRLDLKLERFQPRVVERNRRFGPFGCAALLVAVFVAGAAFAVESSITWGSGGTARVEMSSATIYPSTVTPGCPAIVSVRNGPYDQDNTLSGQIGLPDGLVVTVIKKTNFGSYIPDEVEVEVPEGYHARPPRLVLEETQSADILICEGEANLS
jgi:hypothetical protein